jgi:hypothetical protein
MALQEAPLDACDNITVAMLVFTTDSVIDLNEIDLCSACE